MKRKNMVAVTLACAVAMGISACGAAGTGTASDASINANEGADMTNNVSEKTENGRANDTDGTYDAAADDRPVMKINITEEIPAADNNGEIPGADGVSDTARETATFGSFYQDASGSTLAPVKWIVLDEQDGYTLLMADQIIASRGWMDTDSEGATWAETDLRRWLDNDFYNVAFSDEEKSHMALFDAVQLRNPRYGTSAGEATVDPVSLLSYQELIHYMPTDEERKTTPTDYAIAEGCYQNTDGDAAWWLRSPGPTADAPEYLASQGNLGARAHHINDSTIGVRPVVWVESGFLSENQ